MAVPEASEAPTWTDKLEAWSTLGAAIAALAAAAFTLWLLIHQIGEADRAQKDAARERADATADRELARLDRELVVAERRDAEKAQARTVVIGDTTLDLRAGTEATWAENVRTSVHNYGGGPVLDVTLELVSRSGKAPDLPVTLLHSAALGQGESLTFDERVWIYTPGVGDDEVPLPPTLGKDRREALEDTVVAVRFTDAAGRKWRRIGLDQPAQDFM